MLCTRREMLGLAGSSVLSLLMPIGGSLAWAEELDQESIDARFNQIFETYDIGDALSAEDAAFIEAHALTPTQACSRETRVVNASRNYGGHTYQLNGNWYHNPEPDSALWYRYGSTLQAGSPTTMSQKITVGMRFIAYGFTGSSYEVIHRDEQTDFNTNRQWFTSEFFGVYMGILAYISVTCFARITTLAGDTILVQ